MKGKLTMKGSEALLDFQDGAIQKIKLSGKTLLIELFSAKDGNSEGPPVAKATGTAG